MENKIFIGSGIGKFDSNLVEGSICLSDIPKERVFEYKGKKYLKIKVQKKREPDQFGKTHSIEIDLFEPKKQESKPDMKEELKPQVDDLPF